MTRDEKITAMKIKAVPEYLRLAMQAVGDRGFELLTATRKLIHDKRTKRRVEDAVRRLAKQSGLVARKSRRDCLWYFINDQDEIESPGRGLTLVEAVQFIEEGYDSVA
jgi:hypothetical protein